jgi:3-phosphoshikimate 1-carboxyvinyltransferase
MIGSIAEGITRITNFAQSEDCQRTVKAFRSMGVAIEKEGGDVVIHGCGLHGLKQPDGELYLGNSGTTMRLLLGILAGQSFACTLTGDASLSSRPMSRVTHPLRTMGARIEGRDDATYAPLTIHGGPLQSLCYQMPIPSAQVKSCLLLAGLYAEGTTCVTERQRSRDHTERMLTLFGAEVLLKGDAVCVNANPTLSGRNLYIPGDISSASFFIVGALLLKDSSVRITSMGYNPTRIGILHVLERMGAQLAVNATGEKGLEPLCEITATTSRLRGVEIRSEEIPSVIDELPILMVAATLARGTTIIRGAKELRVKETDRIHSMVTNLTRMGADITVHGDDITIQGVKRLRSAELESFGDHRTAMSMVIAALTAQGTSTLSDLECITTSFPDFLRVVESLKSN